MRIKKMLSFSILLILLNVIFCSINIYADTIWSGKGNGTKENPYLIDSKEELLEYHNLMCNELGAHNKHALLTNDIDLEGYTWSSLCTIRSEFYGSFDGNGHTIRGIKLPLVKNRSGTAGESNSFFSYLGKGGYIKNLTIESDIEVCRGEYFGVIVERNYGTVENCAFIGNLETSIQKSGAIVGENWGIIKNCTSSGQIHGQISHIGGIAGKNNGSIINCYNNATISSNTVSFTGTTYCSYIGGITASNGAIISKCYSSGNLIGGSSIGGIAGCSEPYASIPTIDRCYNSGSIISSDDDVGGIAGWANGNVINCYNIGEIKGKDNIGGIVGSFYSGSQLSGANDNYISNCYSANLIKGNNNTGGIIGRIDSSNPKSKVNDCYYLINTSNSSIGIIENDNDEEKKVIVENVNEITNEQLNDQKTFINWDFDKTWEMGAERPFISNKHTHSWNYNKKGSSIIVKCTSEDCPYGTDDEYTVEIQASDKIYDNTPCVANVKKDDIFPNEIIIDGPVYKGINGTVYNSKTPPITAGNYMAEIIIDDETTSVEFEIKKTIPVIKEAPIASSIIYGQKLSESVISGGEATVSGIFSWESPDIKPNSGNTYYKVCFHPDDDKNYNIADVDIIVSTKKAESKILDAPTKIDNIVYNGLLQKLVTPGKADGGTVYYAVTTGKTPENDEYTESIPVAVGPGRYTIWYKVVGDKNHYDSETQFLEIEITEKSDQDNQTGENDISDNENSSNENKAPNGNNTPNGNSDSHNITITDNKPMAIDTENIGDFKITYAHEIPFYGKSKITPEYFGGLMVSQGNATYEATKIKVNNKKHLIQITGLQGADKETVKKIKKATKGSNGLPFKCNPYFVRFTDKVTPKFKKNGELKSVKILINSKDYKAKKDEFSYDSDNQQILFKGSNLSGSYSTR